MAGEVSVPEPETPGAASLYDHLGELRRRLFWCAGSTLVGMALCYNQRHVLLQGLVWPLQKVWARTDTPLQLICTHMAEGFLVSLHIALWGGAGLSLPVWGWHIWRFVAPGLWPRERRVVAGVLSAAPFLFMLGSLLAWCVILPQAWLFLGSFQQTEGPFLITLYPRLSEYTAFVTHILLAFGLCFQFPLVLVILCQTGLLDVGQMVRFRRPCIVLVFVVAALVTPPDVLSQIALALPLMGLYEAAIIVCRWLGSPRSS